MKCIDNPIAEVFPRGTTFELTVTHAAHALKRLLAVLLASMLVSIALPSREAWAQSAFTTAPSADEVQMLLESTDAKDQAWGAWWIAQARVRNMDGLLEANLEAHLGGSSIEDEAVIDTTLDAIIQLGSNLPPIDVLQSVYLRRPAQGLILLSRVFPRPPADIFLLTLLEKEAGKGGGLEWFAAANLLVSHRAAGLAAALLKDLEIQATILVCDPGRPCGLNRVGGSGAGSGAGARSLGLPPWPAYSLTSSPAISSAWETILASGPVPIYYQRRVLPSGVSPIGVNYPRDSETRNPPSPTTEERLKYVAAAAPGVLIPIQGNENRAIEFRDSQSFATEVAKFRQDIADRYATLLQRLRGISLLSAEEVETLSRLNAIMIIDDLRVVKTPPIPAIPSR